MVASAFTAPHVTEFLTVDVTRTMKLRDRLARRPELAGVKVSPLLFVAKALLLAVRRHPMVNSSWDEAAQEIVVKDYVNLGIAAATPRGLVVPNVKDADRLTLPELAQALADLTATAREGRTAPADMSGGTITITNVGVFGVDTGTPILNPGNRRSSPSVRCGPCRGCTREDRAPPGHAARALLRPPDRRRRAGVALPGRHRCAAARSGGGAGVLSRAPLHGPAEGVPMDRRPTSLVLLLLFVLCSGIAIVVSGSRPGLEQGIAPALAQFVGYGFALVAGLLLVSSADERSGRRVGGVVLGALAVLVLLDLLAADGPNIGAGFVQLVGLVVMMVATIRLALAVAAERSR
ncbi:2-oxo acid dehydrogenase subunit E2 [Blastococcus brunescens]|uniref:2-oxo acid dehydrogenase subunit E2 n=1 Tax=Blastococcus brunescens TaxID=1564165 RepID=UPI003BEF1244